MQRLTEDEHISLGSRIGRVAWNGLEAYETGDEKDVSRSPHCHVTAEEIGQLRERRDIELDHTDGALPHLAQRDVSFVAVSRAPLSKIEPFKKRMGWRFAWVSSFGTDFNYDYHASFTPEEMAKGKVEYNFDLVEFPSAEAPGISVFYKDKSGTIFHTYSAYARGSENVVNTYNYLDLVPKGRDEDALPFTMSWVRHHDRYADGYLADADKPYWPAEATPAR